MIVSKRSWKKSEQDVLVNHYLKNIHHASSFCYQNLLSAVSAPIFVKAIMRYMPTISSERDLLKCYLLPQFKNMPKNEYNAIRQLCEALL